MGRGFIAIVTIFLEWLIYILLASSLVRLNLSVGPCIQTMPRQPETPQPLVFTVYFHFKLNILGHHEPQCRSWGTKSIHKGSVISRTRLKEKDIL